MRDSAGTETVSEETRGSRAPTRSVATAFLFGSFTRASAPR